MEGYDYDAAASTIKIEDITRDEGNRNILRCLKENDPDYVEMWVRSSRVDDRDYCPEGARDMGWVGYYIGKNTALKELYLRLAILFDSSNSIEKFFRGANSNKSIQKIAFSRMDLSGGEIFQSMRPFFENNYNLSEIDVERCHFGPGCARQVALVLRSCSQSLKYVKIENNQMGGEQLTDVIEALSAHPQLESLGLISMDMGRSENMMALIYLLCRTTTELQELSLYGNNIDDEGVDNLAGVLANNNRLRSLRLSSNPRITARGCQSLAVLLENPRCNLEKLNLYNNNVGNEGALIFANALASNHKLTTLGLNGNGLTDEGYSAFSKVLCDNSSINRTFLSNHTLESLGWSPNIPADVDALLVLNMISEDKRQVAIKKMLKHHQHFEMQPFFEWDMKVLPIAINWFERARSIEDTDETVIDKQKLGAIYQFIHAMPEAFEPLLQ